MQKISVIGICGMSTFMYVDHFHKNGETVVADSIFDEMGGKGINQAIAASRMGAEVYFLGAVGDDKNGKLCSDIIKKNNIKASIKVKKGKNTAIAFILKDKKGENLVTEFKSAELEPEDVFSFEEQISKSDILLLQHEVPDEVNFAAIEIAKKHNVKVILNPAPARNTKYNPEDIFVVTPNEQEAEAICASEFKNCIKTCGSEGCLINGKIKIPAIKVNAVDTTGAGDTFSGVLAVCLAEGKSIEDACRFAVTASGISVGRNYVLDAIPKREEIEKVMMKNK